MRGVLASGLQGNLRSYGLVSELGDRTGEEYSDSALRGLLAWGMLRGLELVVGMLVEENVSWCLKGNQWFRRIGVWPSGWYPMY